MEPLKSAAASSSPRAALGFDTAFERETQNLSNPNNAEDGPESFCILYGKIVGSTDFRHFCSLRVSPAWPCSAVQARARDFAIRICSGSMTCSRLFIRSALLCMPLAAAALYQV